MRYVLLFSLLLSSHLIAATETFITRIHSVSWSNQASLAHVIKFQNARVALMNNFRKDFFPAKGGELVQVEVDEHQKLISLIKLPDDQEPIYVNSPFVVDINYQPTLITGYQEALTILQELRGDYLIQSPAYHRAHVWAFEQYNQRGLQSMKAFLFFSDDFIRLHAFKWWYHVAPYVSYQGESNIIERILDKTFSPIPLSLTQWSRKFVPGNKRCSEIKYFNDYLKAANQNDCYLLKKTMYYWNPHDLEQEELTGIPKVNFFEWEVADSFQNAFGISY